MPANRTKTGQFAKGVSGNPKGRKKDDKNIKEAFEKLTPRVIEKIEELLENCDNEKILVQLFNIILDRSLGKPQQQIEHKGSLEITIAPPIFGEDDDETN